MPPPLFCISYFSGRVSCLCFGWCVWSGWNYRYESSLLALL
jgi:hypothetical protein